MAAHLDDKTYRVLGLPPESSTEDSERILSSIFDKDGEQTQPMVHSLGLDPHAFGRNVHKVATVSFERTPQVLLDGRNEWSFTVGRREKFHSGTYANSMITIDTHFLGFTPLNSVKDDEDHKIE
jgi:hypothetical protein